MDIKNKIQLGIQLTSSQDLKNQLNNTISDIEKSTKKVGLEFDDKNIKNNLDNIIKMVSNLKSQTGKGISLGNFDDVVKSLKGVNGELVKISNVDLGNNLVRQSTQVSSAIGQIVNETKRLQLDNSGNIINSTTIGNPQVTTNLKEYKKALDDIAKAQETLKNLNLVDEGKKFDLQNALTTSNISNFSPSEFKDLLAQVRQLKEEEKQLQEIQKIDKDDLSTNKIQTYKELSHLLKEEYSLKTKLISAEGQYKDKLEESLVTNKLLQNEQNKKISNENLTDKEKEISLTNQQIGLQEQLNQSKAKKIDSDTKQIEQTTNAYKEEQKQVEFLIQNKIKLLEIQKQSLTRTNGKDFDISGIDEYIAKLKNLDDISLKDLRNEFKNIDTGIKEMKENALSSESAFSRLSNSLRGIGIYLDIGDVVRGVTNGFRDAKDAVIELDTSLTNLKKVTNETESTYQQFLNTAHNIAMEFGSQSDKVIQATESWAKTGESLRNATELAKNTMVMTKVGDVSDIGKAQEYMLPALQAFNVEAGKSLELVDKYNNLSNNMATDVPKLGEAMSRGASSLATAGNSLEESMALIATAQSKTQLSGETIGNAFKTLSLRIATFKNENGELIPKFEEKMNRLGITMRDSSGQILSTFNILQQVGNKFKDWDKNTQLDVSQMLGGKLQANVVSSVLSDVNELNRAYDLATNSAGSAMNEFKTYQQSIQYSVDRLKESVQNFYREALNSGALKSMVDGLTTVISTFGNMPTIIGLATTAFLMFKGKVIADLWAITLGETAMTVATVGLTSAINALKVAFSTNPLGMIALVTTGAIMGFSALNKKIEESTNYIGKLNETSENLQQNKSSENLVNQYEELRNKINDSKTPIEEVTKAKQELIGVQKQLAGQFPELVSGFTKEGEAIVTNIEAVKKKVTEDKNSLLANSENDYKNLIGQIDSKQMNKWTDTAGGSTWWLPSTWKSEIEQYNSLLEKSKDTSKTLSDSEQERLGSLSDKFVNLNKAILTMKDNGQDISGKKMFDFDEKKLVDASSYIEKLQGSSNSMANGFTASAQSIKVNADVINSVYNELEKNGSISEEGVKRLSQAFPELGINSSNASNAVQVLGGELYNLGNSANNAEDKLKGLSESFNELSGNVDIIDKVIKEMSELGGITASTYSQMISKHPEVLATLVKEGDTIENLKTQRKEYMAFMEEEKNKAVRLADEKYNHVVNNNNAESESNSTMNQNKSKSDTDFNNTARKNSSDTTNQNGQNYGTDSGNFGNATNVKLGSDAGFQNGWRQNTSDSVNQMGGMYQTDVSNFHNAMNAKNSMLMSFQNKFRNLREAIDLDVGTNFKIDANMEALHNPLTRETMNISAMTELNNVYEDQSKRINKEMKSFADMCDKVVNSVDTSKIPLVDAGISKVAPSIASGGGGSKSGKGGSGKSGGSGGSAKTEKEVADLYIETNAYELQKNKIEQVNTAISVNEDKQKSLLITEEEKLNLMKEEQGLYQDKWIKLNNLAGNYDSERKSLEDYLRTQSLEIDTLGNILNKNQVLKEWESWANASSGEEKEKRIQQTKDFQKQIERYSQVVQAELPKVESEWRKVGNEMQELDKKMKDILKKTTTDLRDKVIEGIKEQIKTEQEDKEKTLKKIYDKKIKSKDNEIKRLQDELDSLDNSKEENAKKLAKLKSELSMWKQDDSVFSVKKQKDISEEISKIEKDIKKDDIKSQIDDLNKQKKKLKDSYDEDVENSKEKNKKKLKEQEIYNKANKLLQEKNIDEIQKLMKLKDESFKDIGLVWGENLCKPIQTQIQETFKAIENLQAKAGIKSEVKTKTEYKEWYDDNGYLHVEGNVNVAQASNGGRTPSNIDDGRAMILHSNEMISSADDTKKFDETHDFAKQASKVLEDLNFIMPTMYNNMQLANPPMIDFNKIASSMINNTNDNSDNSTKSVTWKNNITQNIYTKDDSYLNDRAFNKLLRNQAGIFK
ncbi:phage tail tape measure protein [Clostridium botulinum]|uniref:phage tail tape measure protein n=1 Tax=Clostridium botulinum TaxID=1491 RepID=UPI00196789AA|nr:phage tail tape measure protein [Clostridium botulinum]MBN1075973.1 phage tail tape measure protein [Clostridium botulinum]